MGEMTWLDGYSGQTTSELLALQRDHRIDSLVLAFEEALQEKELQNRALTATEHAVLAIEALEREVNNGGYDQFFLNTPEYAESVVEALRRIGCEKTAAITSRALAAVGDEAGLGACDTEYFASGEDIAGRLFEYIKSHAGDVTLP